MRLYILFGLIFFGTFNYTFCDFNSTDFLFSRNVSEENERFIRALIQEMEMNEFAIQFRAMSESMQQKIGYKNAFVIPEEKLHILFISEEWFDTLTYKEKQALIGHELIHIKANHSKKKIEFALASFTAGCFFLLATEILNQTYPPDKKKISEGNLFAYVRSHKFFERRTQTLFNLMLMLWVTPITLWFSRKCERESDIESSKRLRCARGGAQLWQRFIDEEEKPELDSWYEKALYKTINALMYLFSTHPSHEERRAYLEELAELQEEY